MARIHARRTAAAPVRTGAFRHARTNEQRKPSYKVVIEEMTEKKKKLHTTLSFKTQPPPGYTFVAAGDPRLTAKCKDISRAQGLTVYITSRTSSLGEQVGRVGYHFPSGVVEQSCQLLGVTMARSGNVYHEPGPSHRHTAHSRRSTRTRQAQRNQNSRTRAASVGSEMDQHELDTRAAFAIRDLFPKIPEADIQNIVAQAFQKGKSKVGTAADQPFIKRVHLAVGAYIRHVYTGYDRLLKQHSYLDARALVQPPTLDKIIEWRDEKDEPDAVEDILREVIVISDDEEGESEDDMLANREDSVEIISSQEIADTVHVRPLDYSTLDERSRYDRPTSPEDDWAPSVKFIRRLSTPPVDQSRIDRQQAHRNRIWHEAVSRRKQTALATPTASTKHAGLRRDEERLHSSFRGYPHPIASDGTDCEIGPRLLEIQPVHAHNGLGQPSSVQFGKPWDGVSNKTLKEADMSEQHNIQELRPAYDTEKTNTSPSNNEAFFVQRPGQPVYAANGRVDRNYMLFQTTSESGQRPPLAPSLYGDSDSPIPSIEGDSRSSNRQQPFYRDDDLAFSRRQFQDHFTGPRNVELKDDPLSPAVKRRRIADGEHYTPEVIYQPMTDQQSPASGLVRVRPMQHRDIPTPQAAATDRTRPEGLRYVQGPAPRVELVPIVERIHSTADGGPTGHLNQHRTEGVAQRRHVLQPVPRMRPDDRSAVDHHSQQFQPRFCDALQAEQIPGSFAPDPRSTLSMRPRFQNTDLHDRHVAERSYKFESTQDGSQLKYMEHSMPVPPRTIYANDENLRGYAHRGPMADYADKASNSTRVSDAGVHRYPGHPPIHRHDGRTFPMQDSQPSRLLPQGNFPGQSPHYDLEENYRLSPRGAQGSGYHKKHRGPEIIYISSSPPMEER
ncbi:MAG: hypothetical protein Q9181_003016 [Wetmoreana brouardii]